MHCVCCLSCIVVTIRCCTDCSNETASRLDLRLEYLAIARLMMPLDKWDSIFLQLKVLVLNIWSPHRFTSIVDHGAQSISSFIVYGSGHNAKYSHQ